MRRSAGADALGPRAAPLGRLGPSRGPGNGNAPMEGKFDWAILGWYALLLVHAVRRHRALLFTIWVGVIAASVGLMALLPKTYEVETTLQIQRPAGLSNAADADTQTKQAAQVVLRRDNLVALVHQTDFLNQWPLHRAPLLKLKDALWARFFKPPTEEDRIDAFVGLLEKQMWATPGDATVTIGIHLSDPELALRLVEKALQNFLEARHTAEITSIGEVITILEGRTAQAHVELDKSLRDLENLRKARATKLGRSLRASASSPALATLPDPETEQLLVQVKSKRLAIADLEDFHRRRIEELEGRLAEQRTKYSETHPAVLDAEQLLEEARAESPQVVALRRETAPLEAELKQRGFDADGALKANGGREMALSQALQADDPREDDDPDIDYAKSQVRHAVGHYNDMLDRTASARLEQDRAGAAFKYRYVVLWPAQKPLGPYKPKPEQVVGASVVAGLVLALLGVTLVDISSKKLVEPWQIERALGLPLLGTVDLSDFHLPDRRAPEGAGAPSQDVSALWLSLRGRAWTNLALVSPDSGVKAWRLAQRLVAAAGEHQAPVLKAVNLVDLSFTRASATTQALAVGNFTPSGERLRFVVATASPVESPVAISILTVCDGVVLLLELQRSSLPNARRTVELAGRDRVLGAVLASS